MGIYRTILNNFLTYLKDTSGKNPEAFFISSNENIRQMRVTYQTLGSLQRFLEWLEEMATNEETGFLNGSIGFMIMGGK